MRKHVTTTFFIIGKSNKKNHGIDALPLTGYPAVCIEIQHGNHYLKHKYPSKSKNLNYEHSQWTMLACMFKNNANV